MLKRELKINFKSLIIWSTICIVLFLVVFLVYPSIVEKDAANSLNDMLKVFPEEMLKMFNMDISGINSAFGWFKTEGYVFLLLILGIYSSTLGANILVKEESDKTIEFLYSKPINKNQIITSKMLCGIINIILIVLLVSIFNFIGMTISTKFDKSTFWLLSLSPLLIIIPLFLLSLFISTFFNKSRKTMGIGIGIVFISYFLQMLSNLSDKLEFIKYFTLFTLSDTRNIIQNSEINIWCIVISIIASFIFMSLTYLKYNRKEFL